MRRRGIPAYLVAAWAVAATLCVAALRTDEHFEVVNDAPRLGRATTTFSFYAAVMEFEHAAELVGMAGFRRVTMYREFVRRTQGAENAKRLVRSGRLHERSLYAALLVGSLALVLVRAWPWLRYLALFLAALLPLATAAYHGYAVGKGPYLMELANPAGYYATPVTWWGRFAWSVLAVATVVSWMRHAPVERVTPTNPEVFE